MLCPNCHSETSDMSNTCEWCGAALDQAGSPPSSDTYTAAPDQQVPDEYVPTGDASFQANRTAGRAVSEWPPPDAGHRPSHGEKKPWYLTPAPYVVAVLIVLAVLSFLLLRGGGAGALPELVVGKRPTLLNVYSDT